MAHISRLFIHPLKSAAAIEVASMPLDEYGAVNDRRWLLVDEQGAFVSQRTCKKMAHIQTALHDGALQLTLNDERFVIERTSDTAEQMPVEVWGEQLGGMPVSRQIDERLSSFLQKNVRLLQMPSTMQRQVDQRYAGEGRQVSYADGFPLLAVSKSAIDELARRIGKAVDVRRFRANIIIDDVAAHAEDHWQSFTCAGIAFDVVKPCERCVIPSIDPASALVSPGFNKTLAAYRRNEEGQIMFGQNVVHHSTGVLRAGDNVSFVERECV